MARRSAAVVLNLLVLWPVATAATSSTEAEPPFRVSNDPEVCVLKVEKSGGATMRKTTYELFGDGRLVGSVVSGYASGTPELVFTEALSLDDYDRLVADLVHSGLMEYDERVQNARFARVAFPTDEATVRVTLRLESYDGHTGDAAGAVEHSFAIYAPGYRARQFPDVQELAAVDRLIGRLHDIHRQHRSEKQ